MKYKAPSACFLFLIMTFSASAQAGEYVHGGWHPSDQQMLAMESAFMMANNRVKSRKRGCIGSRNSKTDNVISETREGEIRYSVYIAHHNGSCGIKLNFLENLERETGLNVIELAKKYGTAVKE